MIYIFDLDSTIADLSHRLRFIKQEPADWRAFFAACGNDAPIEDVIALARALSAEDMIVVYVTGRSDECRDETVGWLRRHLAPAWARKIYMRKAGDHRQDSVVKMELLDEVIRDFPLQSIAGVFEDRKQVVDAYRARGLRVYQVADGNF